MDKLKKWYEEHESHPYPTKKEKAELALTTGLTEKQVRHWFEHVRAKRKKASSVANAPVKRLSKEAVDKVKKFKWYDEQESQSCSLMEEQNGIVDERYSAHKLYLSKEKKRKLASVGLTETQVSKWFAGLTKKQVSVWFVNASTLGSHFVLTLSLLPLII